ncbi:MAG: hypothetical protein ACYSU3_18835 [Planctomycetota bacterium]
MIIMGLNRLQYVLDEYKDFFNQPGPHQGIGNKIPGQSNHKVSGQVRPVGRRHLRKPIHHERDCHLCMLILLRKIGPMPT